MAKSELQAAKVYRGGVTSHYIEFETSKVLLLEHKNQLRLSLRLRSKGGGTTLVRIEIGSEDYPAIVAAMAKSDRQAAMEAMSAELARQVLKQPSLDNAQKDVAIESVRSAAHQKYLDAPSGNDQTEHFVYQSVAKLIDGMKSEGDTQEGEKVA